VVVVCYYLDQIEDYRKRIGQDRQVYVLTGATKNQGQIVKDANDSEDCILLIQAGLGAGFDLDRFSVMVFASMSFAFVHKIQMEARVNRIHNLHKNQYIYLLGGKCDKGVYEQVNKGLDFHPPAYYNKGNESKSSTVSSTGITTDNKEERSASDDQSDSMAESELPF
jgi:hypothetical protein